MKVRGFAARGTVQKYCIFCGQPFRVAAVYGTVTRYCSDRHAAREQAAVRRLRETTPEVAR